MADSEGSSSSSASSSADPDVTIIEPQVISLMDKLKSPTPSILGRKRAVLSNPPTGKKRCSGSRNNDPKSVNPLSRVKEFKDETLTVSAGRLFCMACRETLSLKKSIIQSHLKCTKHVESKKKKATKVCREKTIAEALKVYESKVHPKGETLNEEQRVYRVQVLTTFMKAGVPLSKLNIFREILEAGAFRLTDTSHMLDLVPFVLSEEMDTIKAEINSKFTSLIFDGTTRLGEVLVVILRYIKDWKINQRLVRLKFLQKSMTGKEIAREIIEILSVRMGVSPNLLLATMRDRASVNNLAMDTISVIYPNMLDVGCFSHALDHVGEKFATPVLSTFCTSWISLFAHSPKSKSLWKEQTGTSIVTFSKTRWWSRWEVMHQLFLQFGDLLPFFTNNVDIGPSLRPKLLEILNDTQNIARLQIELAAVIDLGETFVKATYKLEGDGALVMECYEVIRGIIATIHTGHYPNVQAIARKLSSGNPACHQQWLNYAISCLKPGIDYFMDRFGNDSASPLCAFKAARLFSPHKVSEMKPVASDVDILGNFPFLKDVSILSSLKSELATYLSKAEDVCSTVDVLQWWSNAEPDIPNWASAAQKVLLVQPSSASAERAFSLLKNSFNEQQMNSLEDYVEASLMLQFNRVQ